MDPSALFAVGPFDFSADNLAQELSGAQQKMRAGLETLRDVGDIGYGATPKEEVWRDGKVALYRYRGAQLEDGRAPTAKVPLLIAYALVNRPYMVDLQADKSIVRGLLARGEDVYILDWGYPDRSDRYLDLEDYIQRYLGGAIDHIRASHHLDAINLLGICQGGAFSLCYTALNPAKIRNLVTMVTPVDFHTDDNMLSNWVRGIDVDAMVDALGNIPADMMNFTYLTLKPWRLFVQKYVGLVDILGVMWLQRRARVPQVEGNGFIKGTVRIGDRGVDLARIDMPVLNVFAQHDHLVPPSSSQALGGLVGTDDYSEVSFRGGHIGIYVSSRAQREVPQAVHDWLASRSR